jgi:elongin-A
MPVPKLYELVQKTLMKHAASITDVGDLPYEFVRPILKKIETPEQLKQLEDNCPQLVGETGELWFRFVQRDIPGWQTKKHEPRDPKNWSKVYARLQKEAEKDREAQEQALKDSLQALKTKREESTTKIVDTTQGFLKGNKWVEGRPGAFRTTPTARGPAKTGKTELDKLRKKLWVEKGIPNPSKLSSNVIAERKGMVKGAPKQTTRDRHGATAQRQPLIRPPKFSANRTGESAAREAKLNARKSSALEKPPDPLSAPEKSTTLLEDKHYSIPKVEVAKKVIKRKRPEASPFMAPKRQRKA